MVNNKPRSSNKTPSSQPMSAAPKPKPPRTVSGEEPVLRFSPTAWSKLLFFRDRGQTEIGGFGISAADDLLRVEDFVTVRQKATVASVAFDDEAVADFFEAQVDAGRKPEQFARIWLHSHPGNSPQPSLTDEETFRRVFGNCQWAVMFIVAHGGKCYARLHFGVGPGGQVVIPTEVDYRGPFGPSGQDAWEAEYRANIQVGAIGQASQDCFGSSESVDLLGYPSADDWLEELDARDPTEREFVIGELAERSDLWEESEVVDEY